MFEEEEKNVYSGEAREELADSDEIDELEEGFMKGYEEESSMAECANCHRLLTDEIVEEELEEKTYRFCSEECAMKFEEKEKYKH